VKLSIIIPVYRVEATLDRCVESVVGQDFDDLEVILVDDGSPDRCSQLCDKWAGKDPRISVIHKRNGGLSDARNAGIEKASGDYLTFVDSDDFIAPHTYALLMKELAAKPYIDIIEYPVSVFHGSEKQHLLDFPSKEYRDMEDYWYQGQAYQHTYACNKVYRRALFGQVRFPEGILFEDARTLPLLLAKSRIVATTNQGLYYYCENKNGITYTADGDALKMLLSPHVDIISKSKRRDRAFQDYYLHVLNIQMDVYELTSDNPILPFIHIDPNGLNGVRKLKAIALNTLGIKRICIVNKYLHKIWKRN